MLIPHLYTFADLFDSIPEEPSSAPGPPPAGGGGEHRSSPAMSPGGVPQRPVYTGPPPGFASPNGAAAPSSPMPTSVTSTPQPGLAQTQMPPSAPRAHVQISGPVSGGEDAFMHLLREKNIDESWTWEQTMRSIITEPLYKSLGTMAERKAAFSKYITNLKEQEQSSRRERASEVEPKVRNEMQAMMEDGRVKPWLSYEGMLCRCSDQSAWKTLEAVGLGEAKELWATLKKEMKEKEANQSREIRHRNMDMLMSVLRTFEADVQTRWKDARQTVLESNEWKSDAHLKSMDLSDMIIVFDEYMKSIEKEKTQEMKEKAHRSKREERQRRDWFRAALQEGIQQGWLHAKTDFADVYQRFKSHSNFALMLGQPGSTPLDLFFDVMDDLERELRKTVQRVEALLGKAGGFGVDENTSWDDFSAALDEGLQTLQGGEERGERLGERERKLAWEELQRTIKEEKRRSERKLRHLSEDLRYALKKVAYHQPDHFENEEQLSKPWPESRAKLEGLRLAEWQAFEEVSLPIDKDRIDEARRGAWERFVKRQREKLEEKRERQKERQGGGAQSDEHGSPKRRRGEEGEEEYRKRSSRRAGRHEEEEPSRTRSGRRERRAGEIDEAKERDRKEKRRNEEETDAVKVRLCEWR